MSLIALGVTGGIGAYKSVEVCRGLQKRGHDVVTVMTRSALNTNIRRTRMPRLPSLLGCLKGENESKV